MVKLRLKKFRWSWLGLGLLIPLLLVNVYQHRQGRYTSYLVKEVIDGDTLVLRDDIIVRLFSIDAPKLDRCGSQEAKQELERLVLGKTVTVDNQLRDDYGRLLAAVYVNGQMVNRQMLVSGWAIYLGTNFDQKETLKQAYYSAKEAKLGVFGPKCTQSVNPDNPRCSIKGNITHDTGKNKTYHFPGCGQYENIAVELFRGEQWFCTEEEAQKAGFVKSKNCFNREFLL